MARPKKNAEADASGSKRGKAPKTIASTQSLSSFVKSICDIMRRSNCASALQYVPELTWILFLRILDAQEAREREAAEAVGRSYSPALREPYRWQDWAAPFDLEANALTPEGRHVGWKREALKAKVGDLFAFINKELLPYLNEAWSDEIRRFGMEKKINGAQEKAIAAFSDDMKDLLAEVNQEINLQRKLSYTSKTLDEQDSSVWLGKTLQWGSGLAGLGMAVAALANWWNPAGWVWGAVAVVGFIASLFESKASKRRKAVSKISGALESQIEKQERQIVEAALKHFKEQCQAGAAAVQDYFRLSAEGLAFVGQTLERGAETLQKQSDILNTHFAARILDFAGNAPSESSAQDLRAQINEVRRKVGESIDIKVSPKIRTPKDLSIIESVIQERITLQKTGA